VRGEPIPRAAVRRALLRFPNWLGDTVMALPTLDALRAALPPDTRVWCVGPWVETIVPPEPGRVERLRSAAGVARRLRQALGWRPAGLDLAVVLPNSFEAAMAAWLSGARWRVGYAGDGRAALLTHALGAAPGATHQVSAYLRLLRPLGVDVVPTPPTLAVAAEAREEARALLRGAGLEPRDVAIGLQLGAAFGPSKLWPVDRLAALADRLAARGLRPVLLGTAASGELRDAVQAAVRRPVASLVGGDRPALLPAVLGELAALVAADSGPAHVAAAVGVPTVTLFGPTDPRLTAPLGPRQRAIWRRPPCAPCFRARCPIDHRCLAAVTVDAVEMEVLEALACRG
jgi:heptosyltransferase-2